jgi:hypothetical protein
MSKIKRIFIKNLKKVDEKELNLEGCSIILTGANNSGKSTILRSLPDRLRGEKPELIVRQGEKDGVAEFELTTGEKFQWQFTSEGKEKLIFISKEGFKTPVTKEISGKFFPPMFDIDKFIQSSPKEQKKILQKTLGIDFTAVDAEYKVAFDERTFANREVERIKSLNPLIDKTLPEKEVVLSDIQQKITDATSINARVQGGTEKLNGLREKSKELSDEILQLTNKLAEVNKQIKDGEKWISENKPLDITGLQKQFDYSLVINQKIRDNNQAKKTEEQLSEASKKASEADKKVSGIDAKRKKMLTETKLPDGITFYEDGILVDGLPLDKNQISTSKFYITALKLAALNIGSVESLYFDASPLDNRSLKEIQVWAANKGFQLLIERPDIECGEIEYKIISE